MNKIIVTICLLCSVVAIYGQERVIRGMVVDKYGSAVINATILLNSNQFKTVTNEGGRFNLTTTSQKDTLEVAHVGYLTAKQYIDADNLPELIRIVLEPITTQIGEVLVHTGYYSVPKERATGAFTVIDQELINRGVGVNLLDRLEGVTNSLLLDRRNVIGEEMDVTPEVRIRGISTIDSDGAPLIVVDNFPFTGDINTINPNDVESITVLRDAAAASIWGARAGNGVIVINLKQARFDQQTNVSFSTNLGWGQKPDLLYSKSFLPASTVMEIQKEMFQRGAYLERDQTLIPKYVEWLIAERDGKIDKSTLALQESKWGRNDLRKDWYEHLYRPMAIQQYSLGISGGSSRYHYTLRAAADRNKTAIKGNGMEQYNFSLQNTFKIREGLEVTGSVFFYGKNNNLNGIGYGEFNNDRIYESLYDEEGRPNALGNNYRLEYQENATQNGLLDWLYRPVDEVELSDNKRENIDWRNNLLIKYRPLNGWDIQANFQYRFGDSRRIDNYSPETFYVRNLINRFTQQDGVKVIPEGGILEYHEMAEYKSYAGRFQTSYNRSIANIHDFSVVAGSEISEYITTGLPGQTLYGFSNETYLSTSRMDYITRYPTRPIGTAQIPTKRYDMTEINNRMLSYFANGSYTLSQKYIVSGSVRWDGSNLMGVKANQRGTALWSSGVSWELSSEDFYKVSWLPYMRIRSTYGSSGNIDKTQSHYPTIILGTNSYTSLQEARINHPGNPSLMWERINTLNLGVDWRFVNGIFSGSIEYYDKKSRDLLADNMMDPTTGVTSNYKMNYAAMRTQGWDLELTSSPFSGPVQWDISVLFNVSKNQVTRIKHRPPTGNTFSMNYINQRIFEPGQSVDRIMAFPWNGLRSDDGLPLVYLDGESTTDYMTYFNTFDKANLIDAGVAVPAFFGSLRSDLRWKGLQLGALLTLRGGHVFRRNSIAPGMEFLTIGQVYHMDYFQRWQKPGDEKVTDVPAARPNNNAIISSLYLSSEALIEPADIVRLHDINISYKIADNRLLNKVKLKSMRLQAVAKNLGIIWRKNKLGIDPDFMNALYPMPRQIHFSIQANF